MKNSILKNIALAIILSCSSLFAGNDTNLIAEGVDLLIKQNTKQDSSIKKLSDKNKVLMQAISSLESSNKEIGAKYKQLSVSVSYLEKKKLPVGASISDVDSLKNELKILKTTYSKDIKELNNKFAFLLEDANKAEVVPDNQSVVIGESAKKRIDEQQKRLQDFINNNTQVTNPAK